MVEAANDKYFGEYKRSLQNSMSKDNNRYHLNKYMAYTMLSKYKKPSGGGVKTNCGYHNPQQGFQDRVPDVPARGISFYQRAAPFAGPPVVGKNGVTKAQVQCWLCGRKGHSSNSCPNSEDVVVSFQGMQYMFA